MNFDNNNQSEEIVKEVDHENYKCPGCGENLVYDPTTFSLKCQQCGYEMDLKGEKSSEELNFLNEPEDNEWQKEAQIVNCPNCGAKNVIPKSEITCKCPFCQTAMIVSLDELVGRRPNRVIPFKVSNKEAQSNYCNWIKKKIFAPSKIKKNIPNAKINGVYVPSWTFDSDSFTKYEGRLGEHYTVTVGSGKDAHVETRTRWFRISGVLQYFLNDILVCSGNKISQNNLNKISPFNTDSSYVYDPRFLTGFTAEHYNLSLQDGWKKATNIAKDILENKILSKYSYDVVDYVKMNTQYSKITYKYVILPVWFCQYQYQSKKYQFFVNGETGKVEGKYPVSPIRVMIAVVILIIFILLIYFVFFNNPKDINVSFGMLINNFITNKYLA